MAYLYLHIYIYCHLRSWLTLDGMTHFCHFPNPLDKGIKMMTTHLAQIQVPTTTTTATIVTATIITTTTNNTCRFPFNLFRASFKNSSTILQFVQRAGALETVYFGANKSIVRIYADAAIWLFHTALIYGQREEARGENGRGRSS